MLKTIKRIICPVDVYDFQPEAAEYAASLAKAFNAEIIILYVSEPLPARYNGFRFSFTPNKVGETMRRNAEAKTSNTISKFFNSEMVKGEVVFGLAADEIVRIANMYSSDLIIMASHGRSAFGRMIHGSVTNKVLANTKIPVLVVRPS